MPARPDTSSPARPAVTLQVAPEVPDLATRRLTDALSSAGRLPLPGLAPIRLASLAHGGEPVTLWLFAGIDAALGERLMRLGAVHPRRLLGVALTGEPAAGQEPADFAWVRLGLPRDQLVFWNGLDSPDLVLRRLGEVVGMVALPASPAMSPGFVELVLRDGRLLRIPPDLPEAQLHRLLCRLGG